MEIAIKNKQRVQSRILVHIPTHITMPNIINIQIFLKLIIKHIKQEIKITKRSIKDK